MWEDGESECRTVMERIGVERNNTPRSYVVTFFRQIDARSVSYTPGMKTAVSIPDEVFEETERLASRMKKSRSQLFSHASVLHSCPDPTTLLDRSRATGHSNDIAAGFS